MHEGAVLTTAKSVENDTKNAQQNFQNEKNLQNSHTQNTLSTQNLQNNQNLQIIQNAFTPLSASRSKEELNERKTIRSLNSNPDMDKYFSSPFNFTEEDVMEMLAREGSIPEPGSELGPDHGSESGIKTAGQSPNNINNNNNLNNNTTSSTTVTNIGAKLSPKMGVSTNGSTVERTGVSTVIKSSGHSSHSLDSEELSPLSSRSVAFPSPEMLELVNAHKNVHKSVLTQRIVEGSVGEESGGVGGGVGGGVKIITVKKQQQSQQQPRRESGSGSGIVGQSEREKDREREHRERESNFLFLTDWLSLTQLLREAAHAHSSTSFSTSFYSFSVLQEKSTENDLYGNYTITQLRNFKVQSPPTRNIKLSKLSFTQEAERARAQYRGK